MKPIILAQKLSKISTLLGRGASHFCCQAEFAMPRTLQYLGNCTATVLVSSRGSKIGNTTRILAALCIGFFVDSSAAEIVRAGFDGGGRAPDTWRGVRGDGWESAWMIHAKKGATEFVTGYPRINADKPLSEESSSYLEVAVCPIEGTALGPRNQPYGHVSRMVDPTMINPTKPYEARFKLRLENRWEAWGSGETPSLMISGGFSSRTTSWAIRATPQDGWVLADGHGGGAWHPVGVEAKTGEIVSCRVTVFPETREYRVILTTEGRTVQSDAVRLRESPSGQVPLVLTFAGTLGTEDVRGGSFAFDEIEIEQPPPAETTPH